MRAGAGALCFVRACGVCVAHPHEGFNWTNSSAGTSLQSQRSGDFLSAIMLMREAPTRAGRKYASVTPRSAHTLAAIAKRPMTKYGKRKKMLDRKEGRARSAVMVPFF